MNFLDVEAAFTAALEWFGIAIFAVGMIVLIVLTIDAFRD